MGCKFIKLEKENFEKAENFLKENFSSPTHWKEWNELISKYYGTDFFYFATEENGIITGICPVHRIKNKLNYRLISGPKEFNMPYGGWINLKQAEPVLIHPELRKNESFEAFSLPHLSEFNADYSGFNLLKEFETSIIDLNNSEENIWNSLPSQRRNKIRKALKLNVKISDVTETGMDRFYGLYTTANEQYGLNNLSKDFFAEFLNLKKNIKAEVLTAALDGEILGAVVIVSDKFYSIYWLGLRLESAPNNGYFDLLQWEAIKRAKINGCRYYDLCYIEKDRLPNIYKFKTDYSDNIVKISNVNFKPIVYRVINKIQKLI
jgi:hypothetical protein